MLTSIGRFLRKLRIDNGEILKNMADKLEVSSAFLSAVENGKKKMPENWMERLAVLYNFTEDQLDSFQKSIIDTNKAIELNLENATPQHRDLAITFARHFDSIDEETSKKITDLLMKYKED